MLTLRSLSMAVLACLFIMITGCESTPLAPAAPIETTSSAAQSVGAAYTLGASDKVRITVFGEDDLSGSFEVDGAGAISMPLIGQIQAEGLTTPELEQRITTRLADGFMRDPKVSAEVTNYRPFYILGEVRNPGEYPYTNGLTVLNAVASAGGYTYRANEKLVFVTRADSTEQLRIQLTPNTTVLPGDRILIKERIF